VIPQRANGKLQNGRGQVEGRDDLEDAVVGDE
jgi:hypothetical protein